jgi:E3 ubiquitin-protein ligase TRIP12
VEYPASIVREGGLTACLTYLDFFATSTQRSAVTTAANCCRNIPEDSFPVIRDVMPILLNVLSSNDQKVVEQGCLCVSRVVESFRHRQDKLEELVNKELLKAILRLLLPGTTNLIGPNIHTQFLRVLAITARASPNLSVELFKMSIVDTLYQILTGVSPPDGTEDVASKIDSVVIMQALIHRPREQVFETLNVICELLPGLPKDSDSLLDDVFESVFTSPPDLTIHSSSKSTKSPNEKRIQLLEGCKGELKRFAIILLPTLTDAFSSTVNLSVRQKVLTAQLKMISNLDTDILEAALRTVPYASFLASILSQQDHPTLVTAALQAAELLLGRLDKIYRYQFYREGVVAEIAKLADPPVKKDEELKSDKKKGLSVPESTSAPQLAAINPGADSEANVDEDHDDDDTSNDDNDDDMDDGHDDMSASPMSSQGSSSTSGRNRPMPPIMPNMQQFISMRAKRFMEIHENEHRGREMREKASGILYELRHLASDIEACYLGNGHGEGVDLFNRLAHYFDGDALESITSYELLNSEIVRALLDVFNNPDGKQILAVRVNFVVFANGFSRAYEKRSAVSIS